MKLGLSAPEPRWEALYVCGTPPVPRAGHAAVVLEDRIVFSGSHGPRNTASAVGKSATVTDQALASMPPGYRLFAGEVAMLDITRGRWLSIQHPKLSVDVRVDDNDDNTGDVWARERVVVPANGARRARPAHHRRFGVHRGVPERCAARQAVLGTRNMAGAWRC